MYSSAAVHDHTLIMCCQSGVGITSNTLVTQVNSLHLRLEHQCVCPEIITTVNTGERNSDTGDNQFLIRTEPWTLGMIE